ncbi:hypothetical protein [Saliphagus sp. LR7]|uniref:hypothetical protein n=1 Tax=Saliphagus sp. LR7 TaxID=2282654 RepID=UPI000DF7D52F|nr:hypothetical protein [Saliphagus sp. LR7]
MDRRQYLGAAGTALATATLAGCVGSGDEDADGVFVETDVNGLDLDVEFTEDSDIREVNLINDGELGSHATLAAGETRTTVPLIDYGTGTRSVRGMYRPGEQTLVAIDADDDEHEHDLTIEPASEIVGVAILEEYPHRLAFRIENDGTGPDVLADVSVTGDDLAQPFDVEDGIDAHTFLEPPAEDAAAAAHLPLPAGETIEVVPSDDFLGFPVAVDRDPDDPEEYDSVEELQEEWGSETTDIDVVVEATVHKLLADVEIRFEGDLSEQSGLSHFHNFTDLEILDVATDTEEF